MKKILSIIVIGIFIFCSFGVQGLFFNNSSTEASDKITSDINDFFFNKKIELLMKLSKFPSLSTCIIRGDEVIFSKGYGLYDLENQKPTTENTIYNVAQISKTVTGTALMQLWEQGFLDLDEDVNNYLPFSLRNPHFPDDPITFRMLLSHSSSLKDDIPINDVFGRSRAYDNVNFSGDPPFSFFPHPWIKDHITPSGNSYNPKHWDNIHRPGGYSYYAHINYAIIGYLIERISGEKFIDYCKIHIFEPLEMYDTSFNLSDLDIDKVAIPYYFYSDVGEYLHINELSIDGEIHPDKYWRILNYPAGGLYSTVIDLSHFLIAHVNNGVWNGVRILEKQTIEEMHTIQPPGNFNPMIQAYYGLSWLFKEDPLIFNVTLMGHYGLSIGVTGIMYHIPTDDTRVIFLANGDGFTGNTMAINFLEISLFLKGGLKLWKYIDFSN